MQNLARQPSIVNTRNRMLSQNIYMTLYTQYTDLNNNILVVGGSGAGKTFRWAKPNVMQMSSSYIITDPKGESCRDTAGLLKKNDFRVCAINLIDFKKSTRYNPFRYLRTDTDVIKLIGNLIRNTTPKAANPSDPFWEKSEGMFLISLFQYAWKVGVINQVTGVIEHNIRAVMELLKLADFKEDKTGAKLDSKLDKLMAKLELVEPNHPAVINYNKVMRGAADTVRSIIISANSRLAVLQSDEILDLLSEDEIDIQSIGTQKTVVYCIIPDNDPTFNFLVGLLYTQMFQILYYTADFVYGGELPIHVTFLLDEFANVALPDDFCSLLSTMRSRNISSVIIIQNLAQIKSQFKDTWETITGNCDTTIYLGGNEQSSHKYISELAGKRTIYKNSHSVTRSKQGSSSKNEDALGRDLIMPEEVRKLNKKKCLIFIRGFDPIIDDKIKTQNHPMFTWLVRSAKEFQFDGRIERAEKVMSRVVNETTKETIKIYSSDEIDYMKALDEKEMDNYLTEKRVAEITNDKLPEEPKKRVWDISFEELLALDLDNFDKEGAANFTLPDGVIIENYNRLMDDIKAEEAFEHDQKIDIKNELSTPEEAALFLMLKKNDFQVPQIRAILRLITGSNSYMPETIMKYFSPNMELEEIETCIDLLLSI